MVRRWVPNRSPNNPQWLNRFPRLTSPDLPRVLILDADDSYTRNILDSSLESTRLAPLKLPCSNQGSSSFVLTGLTGTDIVHPLNSIIPHFAAIILGPGPGRPSSPANPAQPSNTPLASSLGSSLPFRSLGTTICQPSGSVLVTRPRLRLWRCRPSRTQGPPWSALQLQLELGPLGRPLGVLNRLQQDTSVVRYNSLTVDPSSISDQSVCSTDGSQILRSFFQVVSDSAHVNSETGIGRSKAYSNLPDEILELSELRRGVERGISSSGTKFQLRSIVFKNSDLSPEDVFKNSIKARSPLGHVWLDSADSLAASQPSLSIRAASAQQGSEQPLGDSNTFWDWLRNVQDELQACTEISSPTDPALNGTEQANGHSNEKTIAAPVGFMATLATSSSLNP
ncbi:Protein phosphatase PP2A regulatory subunit B [Puccinia graminis f. sp. tritici]|uniref:Protein phosphatase PP2A regulatory subunit B n=1 Tax=Puccinia graminis f. sp. tritici TaxID=56615 RepID=A0A5B0R3Y4_PUCGR|nr:Protein phosphatase PP2A regulatory subunit B [Puccinia graminis f. sp. tritici]